MQKVTLEIRDEVNVKFVGLDVKTRRKISDAVKYFLPYAFHMPSYKLGRWDGCIRYCDVGGRTYFNLLDKLLPIVVGDGYQVVVDDQRHSWNFNFTPITQTDYDHIAWPAKHPRAGEPIILRDYQVEVINRFLDNPQCLQQIATGAGKTLITAVLSHKCEPYGRSIVIVPNKDLVVQTEKDYKNMGLDVGVFFGDRKEFGKTHTICTWQSLAILEKKTKAGEAEIDVEQFLDGVVCVMVDEVHKAKADVLRDQLSGIFRNVPIRWGLTGTIPKAKFESQSLFVSLGNLIGKLSASELQEQGVLAQCHVNIVQLKDEVEFSNYQSELKHLLEDTHRLDAIAELILKIKESGNVLVLVDRVNAGKEIVSRLPDSVFVSGATNMVDRKEEYDEIATSTNKIIVATYGVAAVGINIPRIFNLILIEPGKSFVRVIQSIGRGIRKAEDKDFVQIWDVTSSCKFAKRHLTQRKAFYKEANYPFDLEKLTYR